MTLLKTVIVAVDCSENSNQIVASLKQINLHSTTKIIFTHVLPSPKSNHNLPLDKPQNLSNSFYQQKKEKLIALFEDFETLEASSVAKISCSGISFCMGIPSISSLVFATSS